MAVLNFGGVEENVVTREEFTLEKAREWYNSDNESLKELALQAFNEEELIITKFTDIKISNFIFVLSSLKSQIDYGLLFQLDYPARIQD